MNEELRDCPDCGTKPGQPHEPGCDVERCSVCGGQRYGDDCEGHDRVFARWTGLWPGKAEAIALGIDQNELDRKHRSMFFVKPLSKKKEPATSLVYVVFDGPPGAEAPRFVEVEDAKGKGLRVPGIDWNKRDDGYWTLGPFVAEINVEKEIVEGISRAFIEEHGAELDEIALSVAAEPDHEALSRILQECIRDLIRLWEDTSAHHPQLSGPHPLWDAYHGAKMMVGQACGDWDSEAAGRAHKRWLEEAAVPAGSPPKLKPVAELPNKKTIRIYRACILALMRWAEEEGALSIPPTVYEAFHGARLLVGWVSGGWDSRAADTAFKRWLAEAEVDEKDVSNRFYDLPFLQKEISRLTDYIVAHYPGELKPGEGGTVNAAMRLLESLRCLKAAASGSLEKQAREIIDCGLFNPEAVRAIQAVLEKENRGEGEPVEIVPVKPPALESIAEELRKLRQLAERHLGHLEEMESSPTRGIEIERSKVQVGATIVICGSSHKLIGFQPCPADECKEEACNDCPGQIITRSDTEKEIWSVCAVSGGNIQKGWDSNLVAAVYYDSKAQGQGTIEPCLLCGRPLGEQDGTLVLEDGLPPPAGARLVVCEVCANLVEVYEILSKPDFSGGSKKLADQLKEAHRAAQRRMYRGRFEPENK